MYNCRSEKIPEYRYAILKWPDFFAICAAGTIPYVIPAGHHGRTAVAEMSDRVRQAGSYSAYDRRPRTKVEACSKTVPGRTSDMFSQCTVQYDSIIVGNWTGQAAVALAVATFRNVMKRYHPIKGDE